MNTIQRSIVSIEFDFIYLPFYYVVMLWLQWRKKNTKGYKLIFPNVCCPLFTEHNTRILVINHIYLKKKNLFTGQYNTKIFSFLKAVTNIVQRWSSVMTFKYKIVMKSLLKNIKSNMNIWNFYGKNLLLTALANMYKKSENK